MEEVAFQLTRFYDGANFFQPQDAKTMARWNRDLSRPSVAGVYLVAVDDSGRIAAGLRLSYLYPFLTLRVVSIPMWAKAIDLAMGFLPKGGVIREVDVGLFFHREGGEKAAEFLWQTARDEWAKDGNTLLSAYDPEGPLAPVAKALGLNRGIKVQAAVRAAEAPDPTRPLVPWIV